MADACVFVMALSDGQYEAGLRNAGSLPVLSGSGEAGNRGTGDPSPTFYNVGSGKDHTIEEYAAAVAKTVGFEGGISFDPAKPDGMPRKLLDTSRLEHHGWTPRVALEAGIRQTYKAFQLDTIN